MLPPAARPVLPRGSMVKENLTRLATIETRSLGLQTASPTATRSVTTHTTSFTMHKGSLQQWRYIQGACRIELHRLQHRVSQIITQTRDPKQKAPERFSTTSSRVARSNRVHRTWAPRTQAAVWRRRLVPNRWIRLARRWLHVLRQYLALVNCAYFPRCRGLES